MASASVVGGGEAVATPQPQPQPQQQEAKKKSAPPPAPASSASPKPVQAIAGAVGDVTVVHLRPATTNRVTPIGRYNFERSAYRYFMSLHPAEFEQAGVLTSTLERAPLARQAFYESGWAGAKVLVSCTEGRYERTPYFDAIIQRGLSEGGTRFDVKALKENERVDLGISADEDGSKGFYLTIFGPSSARSVKSRSSSTSSPVQGPTRAPAPPSPIKPAVITPPGSRSSSGAGTTISSISGMNSDWSPSGSKDSKKDSAGKSTKRPAQSAFEQVHDWVQEQSLLTGLLLDNSQWGSSAQQQKVEINPLLLPPTISMKAHMPQVKKCKFDAASPESLPVLWQTIKSMVTEEMQHSPDKRKVSVTKKVIKSHKSTRIAQIVIEVEDVSDFSAAEKPSFVPYYLSTPHSTAPPSYSSTPYLIPDSNKATAFYGKYEIGLSITPQASSSSQVGLDMPFSTLTSNTVPVSDQSAPEFLNFLEDVDDVDVDILSNLF